MAHVFVPLYDKPVYRDHEIEQYFDGLAGDRAVEEKKRSEHAWRQELGSIRASEPSLALQSGRSEDSRSVSHIEQSSPVRSLYGIDGRRAFAAPHPAPPAAPPPLTTCFGSSTDVLAREMLRRHPGNTVPIGPISPSRQRTMVRGVNAREAEGVINTQREHLAVLAQSMCLMEHEKLALLQARQAELLVQHSRLQELHERKMETEVERAAANNAIAQMHEQTKQAQDNLRIAHEAQNLEKVQAAALHTAAIGSAIEEKGLLERELLHARLHINDLTDEVSRKDREAALEAQAARQHTHNDAEVERKYHTITQRLEKKALGRHTQSKAMESTTHDVSYAGVYTVAHDGHDSPVHDVYGADDIHAYGGSSRRSSPRRLPGASPAHSQAHSQASYATTMSRAQDAAVLQHNLALQEEALLKARDTIRKRLQG